MSGIARPGRKRRRTETVLLTAGSFPCYNTARGRVSRARRRFTGSQPPPRHADAADGEADERHEEGPHENERPSGCPVRGRANGTAFFLWYALVMVSVFVLEMIKKGSVSQILTLANFYMLSVGGLLIYDAIRRFV